jgi:hypothetical protein
MKTSKLMMDTELRPTGFVIHIANKTQKFTQWAECKFFLMLLLVPQLSNH